MSKPWSSRDIVSVLRSYELDMLVRFFMHYMPMEQRGQLMAEMPVVYEKLTGYKPGTEID